MAGGGDRGMNRRAEKIEMNRRKMADAYLYETGILELTDDAAEYSNTFYSLYRTPFKNLSNPLFKSSRTVVSSHVL